MLDRSRRQRATLIVGSGPEISLVASLLGAIRYERGMTVSRDSILWLESPAAVSTEVATQRWRRVVSEPTVSKERLQSQLSVKPSIWSTAEEELEKYFGRVSPKNLQDDAIGAIRPSVLDNIIVRVFGRIAAAMVLLPTLFLIAIFVLALRVCGVKQLFCRRAYVGKNEEPVYVMSFTPIVTTASGERREFVAASLVRQISRLHLVNVLGLINIVRGEMALVGPSLLGMEDYQQRCEHLPALRLRTVVHPGLMSLSQTRLGRSHSAYDQRRAMEYDLYYIKHRSLRLNVRVILRSMYILGRDLFKTVVHATASAILLGVKRLSEAGSSASRFAAPSMPATHESGLKPVLVIGAGSAGTQLVESLQRRPELGFWPVAIVDDDTGKLGNRISGVPVLGTTDSITAIALREDVEEIIIAAPSMGEIDRQRVTELAHGTRLPVRTIPALQDLLTGASSTDLVDVKPNDLLGRPVVDIDPAGARELLGGKRVLVTGAAGSIGSEVVRQALRGEPHTIYGLDINESDLYDLQQELKRHSTTVNFVPVVASVVDLQLMQKLMGRMQPHVVFHAAAYKHVPLMESYPGESLKTNISGTHNVVVAAADNDVERFVMVSTDKAVRPSSVMGASKRLAELIVREVSLQKGLSSCSVRFGNVLGSRGSVIPLFERQIEAGGPITVTDERMTRYFMTIPEAAGLIIEAGAIGDRGVVYMLDMDEPVRIVDVAERLIQLKGLRPGSDIKIEITGPRPGEKLFEELSLDFEEAHPTRHEKIRVLNEGERSISLRETVRKVSELVEHDNADEVRDELLGLVEQADGSNLVVLPVGDSTPHNLSAQA